jgi:hypothetical protein
MGEIGIELPPVQPDLFRLVHGTHQEANPDREQFNVGQRYPDIAGYH